MRSHEGTRINGLYRLVLSDRLLWLQAYISSGARHGRGHPSVLTPNHA